MKNNSDVVICKDINGNRVLISKVELIDACGPIYVFGFSIAEIAELKNQYFLKGGRLPSSVETIKEVFK